MQKHTKIDKDFFNKQKRTRTHETKRSIVMNVLQIGAVVEQLGVSRRALLYWEELGLIPEPERTSNNMRIYTPKDIPILKKKLEIAGVISPYDQEVN